MVEFIDKTTEQNGTPINRQNLMAMQGFETVTYSFESDANGYLTKIIETNASGDTKTTTIEYNIPTGNNYGTETTIKSILTTFSGDKTISVKETYINGILKEELV